MVRDRKWKIADFGLTQEGTSRRVHSTKYARGTASYRAPELVRQVEDNFKYTNKVDIWALGCIFYEVVFGKKTFADDFAVLQYQSGNPLHLPTHSATVNDATTLNFLLHLIEQMLELNPRQRPKAVHIGQRIRAQIFQSGSPSLQTTNIGGRNWEQLTLVVDFTPLSKQIILLCLRFVLFTLFTAAVVESYSNYPLAIKDVRNLNRWPLFLHRIARRLSLGCE